MKNKTKEQLKIWSAGNGRFFAYTENLKLKNKLESIDGIRLIGSYHTQKGKLFGLQFVIDNIELKEHFVKIAKDGNVAETKKQLSLF
ncbi:hypothetical protein H1164_08130 [Thermoactinomyces daqus]|uniref:Uncharacterized protein n=1 Tax=Thermoactinomyces daqus TaxID=1329516 RepID=A0A7W1XA10_9BACL|nr:hypothetical protein [Thermoactinomyces daqus]MBA4542867.1 hypothetical protein [Thermoactinomyces daqus]